MRISDWSSDVCSSDLLRAAADTLILTRTASATDATLAVRLAGPRLESIDLRGRIGKGDTMFTVQPVDGRRRLTLRSDDAGELLRAFGIVGSVRGGRIAARSEEHTSELQALMRISYAVFCLKKKINMKQRPAL